MTVTVAPRLLGRQAELAQLDAELRRASGGEARCVFIEAQAGMGKSRFGHEFLARHRSWTMGLEGRAYPMRETEPLAIWVDAWESHLRHLSESAVRTICGPFLKDLAAVLPSVAAVGGQLLDLPAARSRVLGALGGLVASQAGQRPLAIFLDDLHAADDSSVQTLSYLLRSLAHERLLVVASARSNSLSTSSEEAILGLEHEGRLRRLHLRPLGAEHLQGLASAVLQLEPPAGLGRWLLEQSLGNPLFALGLIDVLVENEVDLRNPRVEHLPKGFATQVLAAARGLQEGPRELLDVLAVFGGKATSVQILDVAGRTLEESAGDLDALARTGLVLEDPQQVDVEYELTHPLIQEAVYEAIGKARCRLLHRRTARTLVGAGNLAGAAPHWAKSSARGDAEAVTALLAALQQVLALESFQEAALILGSIYQLLPSGDPSWLDVLQVLDEAPTPMFSHVWGDNRAETSIAAMREIERALSRSGELEPRANVFLRMAHMQAWGTGELEGALAAGQRAIQLFEQSGLADQALLAKLEVAWIEGLAGDLDAQVESGRGVLESARRTGDGAVAVQALGMVGCALTGRGDLIEAEQLLKTAADRLRAQGAHAALAWILSMLAFCLSCQGRTTQAFEAIAEGRRQPGGDQSIIVEMSSFVNFLAGRFHAALDDVAETVASNSAGLSRRRAWTLVFGALSAAELGRPKDAHAFGERAVRAYGERPFYYLSQWTDWSEGTYAWLTGDLDLALAKVSAATASYVELGVRPFAAFMLYDLTELAAAVADAQTAETAATQLDAIAEDLGVPIYSALHLCGRGWVAIARGEHESEEAEAVNAAIDAFERAEFPVFAARARYLRGRLLAPVDRSLAKRLLREAADALEACNATWRREMVLDALWRLGSRETLSRSRSGPVALTSRELDVVRLAIEGYTAAQIASTLGIGERTVETHVAHAYAKLGVGNRLELARRVRGLGIH